MCPHSGVSKHEICLHRYHQNSWFSRALCWVVTDTGWDYSLCWLAVWNLWYIQALGDGKVLLLFVSHSTCFNTYAELIRWHSSLFRVNVSVESALCKTWKVHNDLALGTSMKFQISFASGSTRFQTTSFHIQLNKNMLQCSCFYANLLQFTVVFINLKK